MAKSCVGKMHVEPMTNAEKMLNLKKEQPAAKIVQKAKTTKNDAKIY